MHFISPQVDSFILTSENASFYLKEIILSLLCVFHMNAL